MTVLVVGATGSIGHLAVAEAIGQGHAVRALVRDPGKARQFPSEAQVIVGDLTRPETRLPCASAGAAHVKANATSVMGVCFRSGGVSCHA
jgi:uncharacterized protein YbjT (DUF2867 family)